MDNWSKSPVSNPASLSSPSAKMSAMGASSLHYAKPKRESPGLLGKRTRPQFAIASGKSKSMSTLT